jgi:hypothetical protein
LLRKSFSGTLYNSSVKLAERWWIWPCSPNHLSQLRCQLLPVEEPCGDFVAF